MVEGQSVAVESEPPPQKWDDYNQQLYIKMYKDILNSIAKKINLTHNIN